MHSCATLINYCFENSFWETFLCLLILCTVRNTLDPSILLQRRLSHSEEESTYNKLGNADDRGVDFVITNLISTSMFVIQTRQFRLSHKIQKNGFYDSLGSRITLNEILAVAIFLAMSWREPKNFFPSISLKFLMPP